MPEYKTHITWSTIAGVGLGCAAKFIYGASIPQSIFGGVLCSLGGVLPDIDSDTSRAYQRCITTISGTCVLLLASRLRDFALEPEGVVTTCAAVYFFIVYVIGGVVKKLSVHRGMCHSIPFAVIAGELIFILSSGDTQLRLFKASAIMLGVLIHLILDEINSVDFLRSSSSKGSYNTGRNDRYEYSRQDYYTRGRSSKGRKKFQVIHIKNSFGTGLKLIDYKHLGTTICFYVVMAFLGHCAMGVQDFLTQMGDVDQESIQGTMAVERVKALYPTQYDLSVVQWIADNELVLSPGQSDNPKWKELEEMLAIGEASKNNEDKTKNSPKTANGLQSEDEEVVSLLDVINWNSINKTDEEGASSSKSTRPQPLKSSFLEMLLQRR